MPLQRQLPAIAEAGSNIDNVSMDEERGLYTNMLFSVEVTNRLHLASVMRSLRRIQEVVRIVRVKE